MSENNETNEPKPAEEPATNEPLQPETESRSAPEPGARTEEPAGEPTTAPADPADSAGSAGSAESVAPYPQEETEEQYETAPGGGHRITRRTVHRTRVVEDVEETVTEYLPPSAYVAPGAPGHPAPVG